MIQDMEREWDMTHNTGRAYSRYYHILGSLSALEHMCDNKRMPIADDKEYRGKVFRCPFCLANILNISDMDTPFGATLEGGKCSSCGAVFSVDHTGKNQGELYMDTLAYAFDWDFDAAISVEECTMNRSRPGFFYCRPVLTGRSRRKICFTCMGYS